MFLLCSHNLSILSESSESMIPRTPSDSWCKWDWCYSIFSSLMPFLTKESCFLSLCYCGNVSGSYSVHNGETFWLPCNAPCIIYWTALLTTRKMLIGMMNMMIMFITTIFINSVVIISICCRSSSSSSSYRRAIHWIKSKHIQYHM